MFWRSQAASADQYVLKDDETPYRSLDLAGLPSAVALSLSFYNAGTEVREFLSQEEYVLWCRQPLVMEPAYGWAIQGPRLLLDHSLPYKFYLQYPALKSGLAWLRLGKSCKSAAPLLSLRDVGEGNYFHCYNDILAKLALAEQAGLPEGLPLLVGHGLYEKPFFQELISRGELRSRNWCPQAPTRHVAASSACFLKTRPCSARTIGRLLGLINAPKPAIRSQDRIFVQRRSGAGRELENPAEVADCFRRFAFRPVELEDATVADQMELFGKARFIAGIHGAGLANIIFRAGARTGVLELFPPNNIPPHYYWLSQQLEFDYVAVAGSSREGANFSWPDFRMLPFTIPIPELERAIERLLAAG
jgi:hypothetical protein